MKDDPKTMTEAEMREHTVPTFNTTKELHTYIDALIDRPHDYGSSAYAMSLAATAAFNYVASKLGVTGFQASCADLDILRRTRGIKGSFIILKAEDLLYPQYDLHAKLEKWIGEQRKWLRDEAKKKLDGSHGVASVRAHWKKLAR